MSMLNGWADPALTEEDGGVVAQAQRGWAADLQVSREAVPASLMDDLVSAVQAQLLADGKDVELAPSGDPEVIAYQRDLVGRVAHLVASQVVDVFRYGQEGLEQAVETAVNDICGAGPIEVLLRDPSISEVICRWTLPVLIERGGVLVESDISFRSDKQLRLVAQRIASLAGRVIDEQRPLLDARLPNGDRVHAALPPVATDGPVLTIRKFPLVHWSLAELVEMGSLNKEMAALISKMVRAKVTLAVVGGTSTGKTSFLRAVAMEIPSDEYLITIEDTLELGLGRHLPRVTALEKREQGPVGGLELSIRDLVRTSLRMRPDRIIVGEVRGEEALDLLDASGTGHDGSIFSVHANSGVQAISDRLPRLVARSGEVPFIEARREVITAVEAVVFLRRVAGKRVIASIESVDPDPSNPDGAAIHNVLASVRPVPEGLTWDVRQPVEGTRVAEKLAQLSRGGW
jgi:pilus assembly protein CpaF